MTRRDEDLQLVEVPTPDPWHEPMSTDEQDRMRDLFSSHGLGVPPCLERRDEPRDPKWRDRDDH